MNENIERVYSIAAIIQDSYNNLLEALLQNDQLKLKKTIIQLKELVDLEEQLYKSSDMKDILDLYSFTEDYRGCFSNLADNSKDDFIEYRIHNKVINKIGEVNAQIIKDKEVKKIFELLDINPTSSILICSIADDLTLLTDYLLSNEKKLTRKILEARLNLAYANESLEQILLKNEFNQQEKIYLSARIISEYIRKSYEEYQQNQDDIISLISKLQIARIFKTASISKKEELIINQKVLEAALYMLSDKASLDLNQEVHEAIDYSEEDTGKEVIECFKKMKYNKRNIPVVNVRFIKQ